MKKVIDFFKSYFNEIIFAFVVLVLITAIFGEESFLGFVFMFFVFIAQAILFEVWHRTLSSRPEGWITIYPRLCWLVWISLILICGSAFITYYLHATSFLKQVMSILLPLIMLGLGIALWYERTAVIRKLCKNLRTMSPQEIAQEKKKIEQAKQDISKASRKIDEARHKIEQSPLFSGY